VLATTIPIVERYVPPRPRQRFAHADVSSSANPAAIISSRLAGYLKRPWTALSKCPLDKVLVGTHPKRVYYFLTTCPPQPIPADTLSGPAAARIISPSLSSAASEEEDLEARSREQMSPSPELDLSFDDVADPFSHQTHQPAVNIAHNRRAASPPLEREEREFTQMATTLQRRKRQAAEEEAKKQETSVVDVVMQEAEETEEMSARKNSEAAATLFGQMPRLVDFPPSSPFMKASHLEIEMPTSGFKSGLKVSVEELEWGWSEMKSPENVELEELDDLFGGY
jgi:hypothetical protein